MTVPSPTRVSDRLFLVLIALLPLNTVYLRGWIAWKPWLVLLLVVAVMDIVEVKGFPWNRRAALACAVFLGSVLISWPGREAPGAFWRLWLALGAGALLLLVVGRRAKDLDQLLRVVFWSGAVMAFTGFALGLATSGALGEWAIDGFNAMAGIDRINKPAYLGSGFVALTNWHQDPGYAALWANVWLVLSGFAWTRGSVRGPSWLGPAVLGGLATLTILTLSRTGWVGLVVGIGCLLVAHMRSGREQMKRLTTLLVGAVVVTVGLLALQVALDPEGVGGDLDTALEFRWTHLFVLGAIESGEPGVIDPDRIVGDNRLEVWEEYWSRFLEHPVRGAGLGTGWAETAFQEPHNLLLQLLGETGLIGLAGFMSLLVSLLITGRNPGPVATSVLTIVGFAALTQTIIFEPVLWLGLGLWLAHVENREAERPLSVVT